MSPTQRKRTLLGVIIASVVVVAIGATAFVVTRDDHADARTVAPPSTTTSSTTTTTVPRTTTTVGKLPIPDPAPLDAYRDVPITQIGSMVIPKINVVTPIFEGVWLTVVDHGPGHWPNSAMPGRRGNAVFAGHRVTHTHPFFDMDLLAPGDKIIVNMPYGTFTYAITSITIVQPEDFGIIFPTKTPTITLFACNPKHSAAQRIVAKGKLIASKLKPGKPVPLPVIPDVAL